MQGREYFETIAGCRTRIQRAGKGTPVIFLHGAGGAQNWLPFMDRLSDQYDLIVPEHPGFGGSDTPEWLDNIGDLALFYLDFIAALGLDKAHLVGTSLGGWVAAELAVRNTTSVRSLTLVAPAGLRVKGVPMADVFMLSPEDTQKHLFFDPALAQAALARPVTDADIDIAMKNRLALAKLAWEPRLFNPHLRKWMHRIDRPTLVLWGREDRIIPSRYAEEFAGLIKGARVEIFDQCGHVPQVEKQDAFVQSLTRFLGEVRP